MTDDEIIAGLFRLARSGRFLRAAPLLAAGEQLYPAEPKERLRECLCRLGHMLWDAGCGGYVAEHNGQGRALAQ